MKVTVDSELILKASWAAIKLSAMASVKAETIAHNDIKASYIKDADDAMALHKQLVEALFE